MKPGRNDPCPCGSGRKYKRCCQSRDLATERSMTLEQGGMRDPVHDEWCAEALPVPVRIEEPGSERPGVLLVMAGAEVIYQDFVGRLAGGPQPVASALAKVVEAAAKGLGERPRALSVRHVEVADELRRRLADTDITIRYDPHPPYLEECARGLLRSLSGHGSWPPVGSSMEWRGWQLPPDLVSEIFAASSGYFERAPWKVTRNLQAPRCFLPSGREWTVCMLGNAGEEFGLALYSDPADLYSTLFNEDPELHFDGFSGSMISLTFEHVGNLPREARKELAIRSWPIVDTTAYPLLMTVNTPGGGVTVDDARDLIALLQATPRFVATHEAELLAEVDAQAWRGDLVEWTDPESGIVFLYPDEPFEGVDEPPAIVLTPEELRRHVDEILHELGDQFDGALSDDDLRHLNDRLAERMASVNQTAQPDFGGLSPAQVHALLAPEWDEEGALRMNRELSDDELSDAPILANVRVLLRLADTSEGLGRTQAGNLKLAVVRECLELMTLDSDVYLDSLQERSERVREEDVWPLHEVRILAEVAKLIRPRKSLFLLTAQGRAFLESDTSGELYALLFETCFRDFNLGYGSLREWPELQHQVAYTLCRLSMDERAWRTPEDSVADLVLPYALEYAPDVGDVSGGPWLLEGQLLRRLEAFGLVESRPTSVSRRREYRSTPLLRRFLTFEL